MKFTVPLLLAAAGLWLAFRVVNLPVFADFLIATEAELNKVSWPTRKSVVQDTIVVLMTVFMLTVFLFLVDIGWGWLLSRDVVGVLRQSDTTQRRPTSRPTSKRLPTSATDPMTAETPAEQLAPNPTERDPRRRNRRRAPLTTDRPPRTPRRSRPTRLPHPSRRRRREAELAVAATPAVAGQQALVHRQGAERPRGIDQGAIERRVKIEGLEEFFGEIMIPMERVTEMRNGKRVVRARKMFPGYLMVDVEFNDRILYLFRETSGVGDFVGGSIHRPPTPMPPHEVERMLAEEAAAEGKHVPREKIKLKFDKGDRVKVRDGTFQGMEGEVKEIVEPKEAKDPVRVRVELTIFGRRVPVELESWQVDPV